jgi:hypothetical protein
MPQGLERPSSANAVEALEIFLRGAFNFLVPDTAFFERRGCERDESTLPAKRLQG